MNRIAHWALLAFFAAQNSSTISVESRLVSVDVIVRDARGNPVAGLKQDAFTISEDGKAQQIVSFEEHHALPGRAGDHSRPLAPGTVTNVPGAVVDSDLNMLLFDLADTPVLDQAYAKKADDRLQKLPPGHQLALFILSDRLGLPTNESPL
jgi:VWFA-related protein